jgi:hypothetical protein
MEAPRDHDGELATTALQIGQFMDEWMFRILHAGMATEWDRQDSIMKALELFEYMGMVCTDQDKHQILLIEDEEEMAMAIAKLMPESMARHLESFFLQLQLAVSTVARVRGVIEDGKELELKNVMEDGDAGISQQVLKNVVQAACTEVAEIQDTFKGWEKAMKIRETRLARGADEAMNDAKELAELQKQVAVFGNEQNAKTANIIMSMSGNNTKLLTTFAWNAWSAHFAQYKSTKHIHDKWKVDIDGAEAKLLAYKMEKKKGMKSVMNANLAGQEDMLKRELFKVWISYMKEEKDNKALSGKVAEAEAKMAAMKASQKENAKKAMMKVGAASEGALLDIFFKEWTKFMVEANRDKELRVQAKAVEAKLKAFQDKAKDGAKSVMSKMGGGTDTGLLQQCMDAWSEEVKHAKRASEVEEKIHAANSKFSMIKDRNKVTNGNRVQTANELENSIIQMHIFMNWATQYRISTYIEHYGGRMNKKKQQLEQVQQMFKTFATQLEQGIGNTPRSQRKSTRLADQKEAPKPPPAPQA